MDSLFDKPNFADIICKSFEAIDIIQHDFLQKLSKTMKLNFAHELLIACSLSKSPSKTAKAEGLKFLKLKITDMPNSANIPLPPLLLEEVLLTLFTNPSFDFKVREMAIKSLSKVYPSDKKEFPFLLSKLMNDHVQNENFIEDTINVQKDDEQSHNIMNAILTELKHIEQGNKEQKLDATEHDQQQQSDIVSETNEFISSIYHGKLSIEDFIKKLKNFSTSQSERDQAIFKCTIKNLIQEFQFYLDEFPPDAVEISGVVLGSLINNKLTTSEEAFNFKLNCVLESLKCPIKSKRFLFGIRALQQFKNRLPEWKPFAIQLLQNETLATAIPSLYNQISKMFQADGTDKIISPRNAQDSNIPPISSITRKMEEYSIEPEDSVKEKIFFIFNNLSQQNLKEKSEEMKALLSPDYYTYLANYLVTKRVSMEENFHKLYLNLVDELNIKPLTESIVKYTYSTIISLLESKTIKTNSTEKKMLKNLGSWLGMITLSKNKAIFHNDLPLKLIILDAYKRGILVIVVPFISRVLMGSAESKIFKLPNPWLKSLLSVLMEIYHLPGIVLNIKFEIELLFKSLNIDMNAVKPSNYLSNYIPYSGPNVVDFNPSETDGKKKIYNTLNKTIGDLMDLVVNYCVTVASSATIELVLKDFFTEPDEQKLISAAHYMVQVLASSLGTVTIKKYAYTTLMNNLKDLFVQMGQPVQLNVIQSIANENIEIVVAALQKLILEKSISQVDQLLEPSVEARIKARANGQYYVDPRFSSEYMDELPEYLIPQVGGLTPRQLEIYGFHSPDSTKPDYTDDSLKTFEAKLINEWTIVSRQTDIKKVAAFIEQVVIILKQESLNNPAFNQKPFYNLFNIIFQHFQNPNNTMFEPVLVTKLMLFISSLLLTLQPKNFPNFAFAWLQLISHRYFIPHLLSLHEGREMLCSLLVANFEFLEPFLKRARLVQPITLLYIGTLRILTLILHDFPEFLAEYYLPFCDVIPSTCVQLRNIILSAFPKGMKLPDPQSNPMKMDDFLLSECRTKPIIRFNYLNKLKEVGLLKDLASLEFPNDYGTYLNDVMNKFYLVDPQEIELKGTVFNIKIMNYFVLYIADCFINNVIPQNVAQEIINFFIYNLNQEGRYYFLSAIANQLRYPNSHTYFFYNTFIYLFGEARSEIVQEQIARVLIERGHIYQVHRPIPWGLLVTYIELLNKYNTFLEYCLSSKKD